MGFWKIIFYKWNLFPEIAKILTFCLSHAVKNAYILINWIMRSNCTVVAHEISDSEDDVLKHNDFDSAWLVYTFKKVSKRWQ